jgi:hypothetical protein
LCNPEAAGGLCSNGIEHRFGLSEIHPAIQERPFGKLPRFRKPPPRRDDRFAQRLEDQGTTVAVKLDDILAGEGSWLAHHDGQRLIQRLYRRLDAPVVRFRSGCAPGKTEIG